MVRSGRGQPLPVLPAPRPCSRPRNDCRQRRERSNSELFADVCSDDVAEGSALG